VRTLLDPGTGHPNGMFPLLMKRPTQAWKPAELRERARNEEFQDRVRLVPLYWWGITPMTSVRVPNLEVQRLLKTTAGVVLVACLPPRIPGPRGGVAEFSPNPSRVCI
jgi:hypothetical protein